MNHELKLIKNVYAKVYDIHNIDIKNLEFYLYYSHSCLNDMLKIEILNYDINWIRLMFDTKIDKPLVEDENRISIIPIKFHLLDIIKINPKLNKDKIYKINCNNDNISFIITYEIYNNIDVDNKFTMETIEYDNNFNKKNV